MKKQPFFTIGVPVYNTSKWLSSCLDSILCQDFDDFEVICVNDGSTDDSLDILKRYSLTDSRIKIIENENFGVSAARNSAIYAATGKYLYFIDSDDTMFSDALSNAYSAILSNDFPDMLCTSYIKSTNGVQEKISVIIPEDKYFSSELSKDERAVLLWLDNRYTIHISSRFFRTEFIKQDGIFFNLRYYVCEDNDFIFQANRRADSFAFSDFDTFIYYLFRDGSLTTNPSLRSIYSDFCFRSEHFHDMDHYKLSEQFKKQHKARYDEKYMGFLINCREKTLSVLDGKISKHKALAVAEIAENFIGKNLKKLPVPKGFSGVIFRLYRIFGIKNTVYLLYNYRKYKGLIADE